MQLLSRYINGNYSVEIYDDGTKIRETEENEFNAAFPENIDIKITNKCHNNCTFCYESSTSNGNHGKLDYSFIDTLKPFTELAIGGGNPLEHPELETFLIKLKERNIIANITVRQNDFMDNYVLLKNYSESKLIYGIGVSLIEPTKEFMQQIKVFPNAVIHTIAGILTPKQFKRLAFKGLKILILGYKNLGRGTSYKEEFDTEITNNIDFLRNNVIKLAPLFKVVSFDNLSLLQLNIQEQLAKDVWEECYMGDDGKHTMYIDLVKGTYSKNSLSEERFELLDNIESMFKHVKQL